MFVHLVKDYLKKIEDVQKRLEISIDRDEIQTLGLKLRFYYSEIRHYQALFNDVKKKIIEIQEKYGFQPEEDEEETKPAAAAAPVIPADGTSDIKKEENVAALVSAWISRLEEQGVDAREVLKSAGASVKEEIPARNDESAEAESPDVIPRFREAPPAASARTASQTYLKSAAIDVSDSSGTITDSYETEGGFLEISGDAPADVEQEAMPGEDEPVSALSPVIEQESIDDILQPLVEDATPAPEERRADGGGENIYDKITEWAGRLASGNESFDVIKAEVTGFCMESVTEADRFTDDYEKGAAADFLKEDASGGREFCAGCLLAELGRTGAAINLTESALAKEFNRAFCMTALGDLYSGKKLFGKALECFRGAEEAGASDQHTGISILRCLGELWDYDEVVREAESRTFDDSEFMLEAQYLKASALAGMKREKEALKLLENLADGDQPDFWKARFFFLIAKIREKSRDVIGAVDCYERSLECEGENPEVRFNLGRLYLDHKAIPLARNHLLTVVKKFPESAWADQARELLHRKGVT